MAAPWRQRLLDFAKIAVAVLAAAFIIFKVAENWGTIQPLLAEANWGSLALAFAAQAAAFLLFPFASLVALRSWQPRFGYLANAKPFFLSQLTKYLPGSIWVFPTRVYLVHAAGFSLGAASYALLFETGALVTTALAASLVGLASFPSPFREWALPIGIIAALGMAALALLLFAPGRLEAWVPARWRARALAARPKKRDLSQNTAALAVTLGSLALAWLLSGASLFWLLRAVHAPFSAADFPVLISAFSFAWVAGFVVILSPGGIGVREAVLIAVLTALLPAPYPALAALLSRIVWSLCELMLYFFFGFVARDLPSRS